MPKQKVNYSDMLKNLVNDYSDVIKAVDNEKEKKIEDRVVNAKAQVNLNTDVNFFIDAVKNNMGVVNYNNAVLSTGSSDLLNGIGPAYLSEKCLALLNALREAGVSEKDAKYARVNDIAAGKISVKDDVGNFSKEKFDAIIGELDEIAEDYFDENHTAYDDVAFQIRRLDFISRPDDVIDLFETILTDEEQEKVADAMQNKKPYADLSLQEKTVALHEETLADLKSKATTQEELEALTFIEQNIRLASSQNAKTKEYSEMISETNRAIMKGLSSVQREIVKDYITENPKAEVKTEITVAGYTQLSAMNAESEHQELGMIMDAKYHVTHADDLEKIMRQLEGMIDLSNPDYALEFEERVKLFALRPLSDVMNELSDAMEEGKVEAIPELVDRYKKTTAELDDMLDTIQKDFPHLPYSYGDNVDVARNEFLPVRYRERYRDVSILSNALHCVKFCKVYGIDVGDFVKDPNKYFVEAERDMINRYDVNAVASGKSKGDMLYLMHVGADGGKINNDAKMRGLMQRANDLFLVVGGNETECKQNAYLHDLNTKLVLNNVGKLIPAQRMVTDVQTTVQNFIFFDGKTAEEYCASPMGKFNVASGKTASLLDVDDAIRSGEMDYDKLTSSVRSVYKDYMRNALLERNTGKAEAVVDAIKGVADKIVAIKPEEAEKPAFKAFKQQLSDMTHKPSADKVFEIVDGKDAPISKQSKNIVLSSLTQDQSRYNKLGFFTRFASHLPFVKNAATELRDSMKQAEKALKERGVTEQEIKSARNDGVLREKFQGNVSFKYLKKENVFHLHEHGLDDKTFYKQLSNDVTVEPKVAEAKEKKELDSWTKSLFGTNKPRTDSKDAEKQEETSPVNKS